MSAAVWSTLKRISRELSAAGVPPLSPYWLAEAERFYTNPSARLLVEMVGRGGDKSRTSAMMAIAEVLSGGFRVPPGETHFYAHVSENREEAGKTLSILEAYLKILAVPAARTGDTITLTGIPLGFKVLAARVGAVSGFRCVGWTADEAAKWDDDGADPTEEILASIRAMTVTHANARGRMISSPVITAGTFYETWKRGDDEGQLVGQAPSWIANPSITEAQTRKLERSEAKWSREYAAIPSEGSEEALFPAELIDRSTRLVAGYREREIGALYSAAMDPSLGRNAWTFVIAGTIKVGGRWKAAVVYHREWRAPKGTHLDPGAILGAIAAACRPYGVHTVWTDQFHAETLAALAHRMALPISLFIDKPTQGEKLTRYESALTRFLDDGVELPRDPLVRADLLAVRRRVSKGLHEFGITMAVDAAGRHADYAPSITLAFEKLVTAAQQAAALASVERRYREVAGIFGPATGGMTDAERLEERLETEERLREARAQTVNNPEWRARQDAEWRAQVRRSGGVIPGEEPEPPKPEFDLEALHARVIARMNATKKGS